MWVAQGFIIILTVTYIAAAINAYFDGEMVIGLILTAFAAWGALSIWQLLKIKSKETR